MIRVGVLTSSRADYGIYLPLLKDLKKDEEFELSIIAFGTHLSHFHGYTINGIIDDGFEVKYSINSLLLHDDANSVASACALTALKFADFWKEKGSEFDVVLCLGDRYEMFGAVTAGIPFNIKFAHIHGGETTLGAIDNIYRHSITLASAYHFTSTEGYAKRVKQLIGSASNILVVGSLSLKNISETKFLNIKEFKNIWKIDLAIPSILVTVHSETMDTSANEKNFQELANALKVLQSSFQIIITMPNSDTLGSIYRNGFLMLKKEYPKEIQIVENFGSQGYFSCMRHVKFLLGNTSSGIIEAASLKKYVINVGRRQLGRDAGGNVVHTPFISKKLIDTAYELNKLGDYQGKNIYYKKDSVELIIDFLKNKLSNV